MLCFMRDLVFWRAISLLMGCEYGSKFDLCIYTIVLVLLVGPFEHGNGELSYANCISWLITLARCRMRSVLPL